jgi:hypothetical protein
LVAASSSASALELLDGSDAHRDVAWIEVPG